MSDEQRTHDDWVKIIAEKESQIFAQLALIDEKEKHIAALELGIRKDQESLAHARRDNMILFEVNAGRRKPEEIGIDDIIRWLEAIKKKDEA